MAPEDELVDIVDETDRVVGRATRAAVRAGNLWHRAVYVVVTTSDDGVVVHKRAMWKDVYPGRWDICFGGVVDAGEAWDDAARRELAEEAGITPPLTAVGTATFEDASTRVVGGVYRGVHDGPYDCPDGEVVEVRVVPRRALQDFLATHPHCPDSAALVVPVLDDEGAG